ncbi:MAG TPA: OmpA family protein [Sphingopyxis sp.]|nr:OmpA family protein [Sphingopyxis sp.]
MKPGFPPFFRAIFILLLGGLLAACQSTPKANGFTPAQVATLKQEGFVPATEDDWMLTLPDRLLFPSDQSEMSPEKLAEIAQLAKALIRVNIMTAVVEGHTDSTASDAYNLRLSQARARTVAGPMITAGMRFSPEQIVGKGKAFPISSNETAEGRRDNRRVVIIVSPM